MSDYLISRSGAVHVLLLDGIPIEGDTGPLRAGDLRITGGMSLWVKRVELLWRADYQTMWTLMVRVTTKVPDRFNPTMLVDVLFTQNYSVDIDEDGTIRSGLRVGETPETWVAHRVHQALSWAATHEVSESVLHDGKLLVDAHADDPFHR